MKEDVLLWTMSSWRRLEDDSCLGDIDSQTKVGGCSVEGVEHTLELLCRVRYHSSIAHTEQFCRTDGLCSDASFQVSCIEKLAVEWVVRYTPSVEAESSKTAMMYREKRDGASTHPCFMP